MIIWKFPRSYFCVFACFVNMLNLKDIVFGGVYDMHETSNFWACDYFTGAMFEYGEIGKFHGE